MLHAIKISFSNHLLPSTDASPFRPGFEHTASRTDSIKQALPKGLHESKDSLDLVPIAITF